MQPTRIPVASESVPFLLFSGFAALLCALLDWPIPAMFLLLLSGFILFFFRDPVRVLPNVEGAVVCPADGKIIVAEEVEDTRFLKQRALKISVFMNVFNVHVNRIPLAGTVERVQMSPGRFYSADQDKAVLHNEYCALTIVTPDARRYTVVQIAGLIARRIVCRAEQGDQVQAGERFGLIRFGSRVDIYLPLSASLQVSRGQIVKSGETVLALLQPEQQADSPAV